MENMKWDSKKWKAYVEEHGSENLLLQLKSIPISKDWPTICWLYNFNPLTHPADLGVLTALGLNMEDFLVDDTVTGIEAIQALIDGKTLIDGIFELSMKDGIVNHCASLVTPPLGYYLQAKFTIKTIDNA